MAQTHLSSSAGSSAALIRNEPVQARSTARLAALLDAAAQVVDEIGYERLTTAMVAERADASIGTVYRYFPDRIAVLQSLAARNADRITDRALEEIADPRHTDWISAMTAVFELYADAFRTEPGFAALRQGDVLDLRPAVGSPANAVFADQLFEKLVARFDLDAGEPARFGFESAVEVVDALVARAFARDPQGYEAFLMQGRRTMRWLIGEYFAAPAR